MKAIVVIYNAIFSKKLIDILSQLFIENDTIINKIQK